ncbi:hypothetical protein [Cupriavidus sp. D39]|uniref:hypothetical protein n=1 Tax=Cupriavidus sp. D39 TaxID=2997877 RepID=UPI00226E853E|nr:hypothetical protein [Cupriavidus sp. D39]MCY0856019.1 hypothetical protein [Cupriavidus sp. D39]
MEGEVIEANAGSWDTAARQGQKYISRHWARLLPATKTILAADGYDEYGRFVAGDDSSMSDVRHLEYALGVLAEAQWSKVPSKKGDEIAGCFMGDDVLHQGSELLGGGFSREPEFIEVAVGAILKHQTASALQSLYFSGGTTETPTSSAIWGGKRLERQCC